MGPTIDQKIANLRRALGAGKVATRDEVQRTLQQLDTMLAAPDAAWVLGGPATVAHSDWPRPAQDGFAADIDQAITTVLRPAFGRYRDVIRNEILPRARDQAHVGLTNVPGGDDCYRRLIKVHTSLELTPAEIHRFWSGRSGPHPRRDRARGRRRPRHPRLRRDPASAARRSGPAFFHARRDRRNSARRPGPRGRREPVFLRRSPRTSCVVKPISPYEEKDSTIAYYQPAAVDGRGPGRNYVNTFAPQTRPRFEAEVLAFHESIPGHHIQRSPGAGNAGARRQPFGVKPQPSTKAVTPDAWRKVEVRHFLRQGDLGCDARGSIRERPRPRLRTGAGFAAANVFT